jgi:predicted kinase
MTEKRTPVVAFYGKVRIPTIGHRKAIDAAKSIAKRVNGTLKIALSGTSKPLNPDTKKKHAELMFKHPVQMGDDNTKNLFSFLSHLNQNYNEVHLVAGSDRAPEYRRTLQQWNGKADRSGKVLFDFKVWKVHEVEGVRAEVNKHPTKMTKEELEKSVSATKLETLARNNDYESFKAYHPGFADNHVQKVFNQIRLSSAGEAQTKSVKQIKSRKVVKEDYTDIGELDHKKFVPMLDTFVQFASKKLGIKSLPSMRLEKEPMSSSFGGYNPAEKSIVVITKNRHPMDIYRTVAHELVHHKQNENGLLGKDIRKEGSTGSPIENEANAEAGKIMRWFAKANPNMFKSGYVTETYNIEEGLQDPGKMKAVFMAGGPGSGKDFVMKKTLDGLGLTEINSDNAFEHLMKMRGLNMMMPKEEEYERDIARGIAKRLTKEKERLVLAGRRGVIINGTADDPKKIASIKTMLDDLGYETEMLFVNTRNDVSRERNFQRGLDGGRKVPDGTDDQGVPDGSIDIRTEKWEAAQEAKVSLEKIFGKENFVEFDNSDDMRKVSPARKKEIEDTFTNLFKRYRKFVSTPAKNEKAADWIEKEKQKRQISDFRPARATTMSQRPSVPQPQAPQQDVPPNASEMEQARRIGLTYFKFGRWGRQIQGKNVVTHTSRNGQLVAKQRAIAEDLRNWFSKTHSEGGWKRVNTKGEVLGPCARDAGEAKPKCMSNEKLSKLSKKERASAVRAKRKYDPNPERKGEPINVSNFGKGKITKKENMKYLEEKNIPTNPGLWSRAKALAKSKFDVYPSAYANGWASKWYKSKGGGWKTQADESFESFVKENTAEAIKKIKVTKKKVTKEDNNTRPDTLPVQDGIGPEYTRRTSPSYIGFAGIQESVESWANSEKTLNRFIEKYGDLAEKRLYEAAQKLNNIEFAKQNTKSFAQLREAWEAKAGRDMGTVPNTGKEDLVVERGADSKGLYRSTESGAGLTRKGAKKFGIKTAVTTPPSKLDPKGKAAKRRKSFCARMGGMKGPMKDEKGRPTRKAMSLRRWNCEE